ncbi:MAG: MTH938/NDUFAF3 family protein [Xanthomonadaceae bacterium]|nr:MTH938/NDUFAF3 family protein [Xanthomonadaceae bacterium]
MMAFSEHRPEDSYFVHSLSDSDIRIVDTTYRESLLLTPDTGVMPWPVESLESLEIHHLDAVFEYRPDVLLLASGRRQHFPRRDIQIALLRQNIGLEVMTLDAAARTFNVLASEDRRVMAALIWEASGGGAH